MKSKRMLTLVLALTLVLGMIVPGVQPTGAVEAAVEDDSYFNFDNEGLWMTEIYANDAERNAATSTREANGHYSISLFDTASDLMEFVELVSTHEEDINLNDHYEIYYNDKKMTITTCDGSSTVMVKKGQPIVLWNLRSDETVILPTEEQFRRDMNVNPDAVVIRGDSACGWASSSTFTVKSKADGRVLCTFNIVNDTHAVDGLSVSLKLPMMFSNELEVYRAMNLPSPGYINDDQVNGMLQTQTSDALSKGVFITEICANDANRKSTYGIGDDFMECVEITNNTDTAIDLNKDYQLAYVIRETYSKPLPVYKYSSSATNHQGSSENCTVPAGGTAVVWIFRETYLTGYTKFPTEKEFRSAHSIPSDVPVYIATKQNGMSNTDRGLELYSLNADGTRNELKSWFFYHAEDCAEATSAVLQINPDGPEMLLQAASGTTTMGKVNASQLSFTFDNGEYIQLHLFEGESVPASIMQGEDLRLRFYYKFTSTMPRLETTLFYRLNGKGDWIEVDAGGIRLPNTYEPVVTAEKLFDQDYVEVYAKASNPHRSSVCGIFRIDIKKLNDVDGIRTNISDGEMVRGTVSITANDGTSNASTKIYVDGVKQTTTKMLEDGAYFSFYSPNRDTGFHNQLTTNKNKLIKNLCHWIYTNLPGQVVRIDSSYFSYNSSSAAYNVTLRFWSGTTGAGIKDTLKPDANRDDYNVTNMQMKLPNGKTYLPTKIGPSTYNGVDTSAKTNLSTAYDAVHYVGDSKNMCPYMDVTFSIPAADAPAVGVKLDTTTLTDGEHTLKVTNGTDSKTVKFIVDNTAPVVNPGVSSGATLTGNILLDPEISDAYALDQVSAILDGQQITLPYSTTAFDLGKGSHTLEVYARDGAGNETTKSVTFQVADVSMAVTDAATDGITHNSADLHLTVSSASNAQTTFYQAWSVEDSAISAETTAGLVPYITYTVNVGETTADQVIMASWKGTASNMDKVHVPTMYAKNIRTGAWDKVGTADSSGVIENATFAASDYVQDGKATLIIQCNDSNIPDTDTATNGVKGSADWDGTTRPSDYDFAFAWLSDTQIYAQKYPSHFNKVNKWIVANWEDWKLSYVIHTGDIIDDWDAAYQWEAADKAMKIFDDAGIPYGVLAGNHDVASVHDDRATYYKYFGEHRVKDQPTFGGSYENNYGHYDLISQNGQDFIIVYMSWNIYEEEINWMNEVLAKYADRKAILCFHSYTHVKESVDGLLDYWGVLVRDYVVKKNPNVFAVLNGHYSGATYQTVMFDDDGDGTKERTVYQICTDYQSLDQGGMQYIKFLYFDLDANKVYINAYSPKHDDYNYYDGTGVDNMTSLAKNSSNGVVSNTNIDSVMMTVKFDKTKHTIQAESMDIYVGETKAWATAQNDASGKATATVEGLTPETDYAWYAAVTNAETGKAEYKFSTFTTTAAPTLTGITIGRLPSRTTYFGKKDGLDLSGGMLKLHYNDGSTTDIPLTEAVVTGFDNTVAGKQTLTVTYEGMTCNLVVEITTASVEFRDWDGRLISSAEYMYGDTVAIPADPVRAADDTNAYTFSGWSPAVRPCTGAAVYTATYTAEPLAVPTLTAAGFTLSFEDEILVNFYFTAQNVDASEYGMLVFRTKPDAADFALADDVYEAAYVESSGRYMSQTDGIAAKEMGDIRYYAAYAKGTDGSYVYSPVYEYSPKKYAMSRIANSNDENLKALCVAMLNYGTAAQEFFDYRTADLMNAELTEEQQALVRPYASDLFRGPVAADSAKAGSFAKTGTGFSGCSVTVSFDGAFAINYYMAVNSAVDSDMVLYYWSSEDYAKAATLSPDNATGKVVMQLQPDGSYWAQVSGIAAKALDDTYYVAGVYTSDSGTCCTGVIAYSLSKYCMNNAKDGNAMQALAANTAMYGYYAKVYFSN